MGKQRGKQKRVRWGILGVAKINNRLLPAFAKAVNATVAAIASRSADRAKSAADQADIPQAYGCYEALLDDESIEAVYIPLPNSLHAEWTLKAADRGKHVMCEKPLAPTADEARRVVDYCRGKGVQLMDGFMWPHHPRTTRIKQCLESGMIGEVRRVAGAFTFRLPDLDGANIRLETELGGGSLLDVGCYPVFGIRWAFGAEPVRAYAAAQFVRGVDVAMSGLLWFADGGVGAFDCGFTLPQRQWLEITGTEGALCVDEMWVPSRESTYSVRRDGRAPKCVAVSGEDQIVNMIEDFGRSILLGRAVSPDPDEAVKTLRVLDSLARSVREGKPVDL